MRSIILLALALLSISQVIVAEGGGQPNTQTVEALVIEHTAPPPQAAIAEKEPLPVIEEKEPQPLPVIAEKEPQQQAQPLEQGKVTVAEAVIEEPVAIGGKVTALPVIEETIVAGKLPAAGLSAPQPSGIQVIVPSAPERGNYLEICKQNLMICCRYTDRSTRYSTSCSWWSERKRRRRTICGC